MMNEVLKAIFDRRSNRAYSDVQLTEDELKTLIDVALASPTARNTQYWHFSVVQNQALLEEINDELARLMEANRPQGQRGRFNESGFQVFYHAPTVFFISTPIDSDSAFTEIDAGIASENLAIAAQGMGLGSVILGLPRIALLGEKEAYFNEKLGVPEGYRFSIAVAVGHPTLGKEAHPIGENKVTVIR